MEGGGLKGSLQVDAEIYARFGSKQYPSAKRVLHGTLLKDYNKKPLECQVLVTLPNMLEQLLLSSDQQDWVKKLRYVIFDEIHCIADQEGGAVWEHLLQLIPCPFLALSATVGNPQAFHGWLRRANLRSQAMMPKGGQAPDVCLVIHDER